MKQLAQVQLAPDNGFQGFGNTLGNPGTNGVGILAKFISTAVGVLTIVAIIWFIFNIIVGAIGIINSGGDKQMLENARKKIFHSIFGLLAVVAAIFIIELIGLILGIPNILNLQALICQILGTGCGGGNVI